MCKLTERFDGCVGVDSEIVILVNWDVTGDELTVLHFATDDKFLGRLKCILYNFYANDRLRGILHSNLPRH